MIPINDFYNINDITKYQMILPIPVSNLLSEFSGDAPLMPRYVCFKKIAKIGQNMTTPESQDKI